MAEQPVSGDLSLVPYSGDIILRHNNAIVLYNPESRQLSLQGRPHSNSISVGETQCPWCHRPFRNESPGIDRGHSVSPPTANMDSDFVSPEYFRTLQNYPLDAVQPPGGPPSPQRRLAQPSNRAQPSTEYLNGYPANASSSHSRGISSAAFCQDFYNRFFVEKRVLGKGGKGVVLLVEHCLDGVSLGEFACKRVPVGDDHEWLKKVLVEVVLLQRLSHQNLVSYRHVWLEDVKLTNFGPSVPCAFILQQYCNAGDLQQFIVSPLSTAGSSAEAASSRTTDSRAAGHRLHERARRRSKAQSEELPGRLGLRLSFDEIYSFFRDITSGLNYLHSNGFIHRDLKPSNCLLHRTGGELKVLVSDFGEAQEQSKSRRATGATGTISYCAPEVLGRTEVDGPLGEFTTKSDIFSLGMILYFMCFGRLPYRNADSLNEDNDDVEQLRAEISAWEGYNDETRTRSDLPEQLYKFLRRLLSVQAAERPSAEDILRGIGTGAGLGEDHQPHQSNASSIFQDDSSSSRILAVDTPTPGTPTSLRAGYKKPSASSTFTRTGHSSLRSPALPPGSPDDLLAEDDLNHTYESPNRSSLVLRRPYPSSSVTSPTIISRAAPAAILPPPTLVSRTQALMADHAFAVGFRVIVFLLKVFVVVQSCSPFATKAGTLYPLLGLAVVDLVRRDPGLSWSIGFLIAHILAVYVAKVLGMLCCLG